VFNNIVSAIDPLLTNLIDYYVQEYKNYSKDNSSSMAVTL